MFGRAVGAAAGFDSVGDALAEVVLFGDASPPVEVGAGEDPAGFGQTVQEWMPFGADLGVSGSGVIDAAFESAAGADRAPDSSHAPFDALGVVVAGGAGPHD